MASPITTDVAQGHRYGTRQQSKNKKRFPLQRSQALVNSLPDELLCEILKMTIGGTPYGHRVRKYALINVCYHWREIILNTPKFWSFIRLDWSKSLVEAHVKRSCQCPLDIVLDGSHHLLRMATSDIDVVLNVLIPTAHRWNTLTIEERFPHALSILNKLDSTVFPILTSLSISQLSTSKSDPRPPRLLSPKNLPMLKDLTLWGVPVTSDFQIPPTLERLTLFLRSAFRLNTWLPVLSRLKALSLDGNTEYLPLQPDSIHLPLLARFTCSVTQAEPFLQALLAPNLTHVVYVQSSCESLLHTFNRTRPKWKSVRELTLPVSKNVRAAPDYSSGLSCLCLVTSEIRGVEVMDYVLNDLLDVSFDPCPIDQWECLERVAIVSSVGRFKSMMQKIVPWLERRKNTGKPRLKLGFSLKQDRIVKLNEALFEEIGKFCDEVDFRIDERIAPLMPGYTLCAVSDGSLQTLSDYDWSLPV